MPHHLTRSTRSSRSRGHRILTTANWVLLVVGAVGVVVMMLHIVANAAMRAFLNDPLTGTNEVVSYWYMPLVALFGFIVAQRERGHTEARVLFDRLPRASRFEIHVGGLLLTAVVCAGFAWYGWQDALHNQELGLTGGVVGLPIWPMTFLVPITYAVLMVQVLTEAVLAVMRRRADRGREEVADADVQTG